MSAVPRKWGGRQAIGIAVLLSVSCAIVGFGMWKLNRYEFTPAADGSATVWPDDLAVRRATDRCTVVMALHPECSCSEASLTDLATALGDAKVRPRVNFLFADYAIDGRGPRESPLWKQAAAIPGAELVVDARAELAGRFGALTSGEVRVFDQGGYLIYQGGVTGSRGHAGDNPARSAFVAALDHPGAFRKMPVFGCDLDAATAQRPISRP